MNLQKQFYHLFNEHNYQLVPLDFPGWREWDERGAKKKA